MKTQETSKKNFGYMNEAGGDLCLIFHTPLFNWNSRVPKVILPFVDKTICSFMARSQRRSIWPILLGSTVMSALKNGWKCVCLDLSAKKIGETVSALIFLQRKMDEQKRCLRKKLGEKKGYRFIVMNLQVQSRDGYRNFYILLGYFLV